jgi:ferredoxin-type protein NapH
MSGQRGFRWLLARRLAQASFLVLFLTGVVKGTLASSLTLGLLPLSDPFIALQTAAAGHLPSFRLLLGAIFLAAVYAVIGGRMYCAWVCPVNVVTDAAAWLRTRLGLRERLNISRRARYWGVGVVLVVSAITGTAAWEAVNPVTMLHRGLVFGTLLTGGAALSVTAAVFLLDLLGGSRVWCGQLCPVGAFYGLLGGHSLLRVRADRRRDCDNCLDCYRVCPEPQVITPALRGAARGIGPVITSRDCTNCGRCIDVCDKDVFAFGLRHRQAPSIPTQQGESAL